MDYGKCQQYLEGLIVQTKQYSSQREQEFRSYVNTILYDQEVGEEIRKYSVFWSINALCIASSNFEAFKIYLEYLDDLPIGWIDIIHLCRRFAALEYFDSLELLFRHPSYKEYFYDTLLHKDYLVLERMHPQITQIIGKIRSEANIPPYDLDDERVMIIARHDPSVRPIELFGPCQCEHCRNKD
jgi:hypothetical protein